MGHGFKSMDFSNIYDSTSSSQMFHRVWRRWGGSLGTEQRNLLWISSLLPLLNISEITKARFGQKEVLSASRGQSLLENPSPNLLKSLWRIADTQVERSLHQFYLHRKPVLRFLSNVNWISSKHFPLIEVEGLVRVCVISTFTCTFKWLWNLDKDFCRRPLREWISQKGLECCTLQHQILCWGIRS